MALVVKELRIYRGPIALFNGATGKICTRAIYMSMHQCI